MYRWLVLLHVLAAFAFGMTHGASANVAFHLPRETSHERLAVLLDLSTAYLGATYAALLVLLLSGLALGFLGAWWGRGWIWLALGLLMAEFGAMGVMATRPFSQLRQALGLPYFDGRKRQPAGPPASAEEVTRCVAAIKPLPLALVGYGGLAVIIWLMLFKPF